MRDFEIRAALHQHLRAIHHQEPGTRIIDELGLCQGTARIDVAVVNGYLNGFEIKSAQDTLERLPQQQEVYCRALNYVTLVVDGRHVGRVADQVPEWWGILGVRSEDGWIILDELRPAAENPQIDASAVAQLLWRDEALGILAELGIDRGFHSKPRRVIWRHLADSLPAEELAARVRQSLKARPRWRAARRRMRGGATSRPSARSSDSLT